MAKAEESLTKRTSSMPMCTNTMKTMRLRMTAAMKDQFIKYADKRAADFCDCEPKPNRNKGVRS